MSIPNDVRQDVIKRLARDYKFKVVGDWFRGGVCPGCGKKEFFAHAKEPWTVKCGRENNCGWSSNVKELYPDAFANFNERYQPTEKDPDATANAYMQFSRGFPLEKTRGWWRQGKYWNPNAIGKYKGTATVKFDIDRANSISMERFIEVLKIRDPEDGVVKPQKAHFSGKFRGMAWMPPGVELDKIGELWLVEGCIDAIALNLKGIRAAAILACTNYPEEFLKLVPLSVKLVWALDGDKAGKKYILRHAKKATEAGYCCEAAIIPPKGKEKLDWNDAYQLGWLDEKGRITGFKYHGELLMAKSPFEKAMIIWARMGVNHFAVDFGMKYYWFALDLEKFNKARDTMDEEEAARQSGSISQIANCHFEFLYFLKSRFTDESWYYAKVQFPHKNTVVKDTFSGGQVAASAEFKKRLLSIAAGALFTGKGNQLDWIINRHLSNIKTVETVDFLGYAKEYGAYIFDQVAIADGKEYPINDEDFFEIGKHSIKTMNKSVHITIGNREDYKPEWKDNLWNAFGPEGFAALTFFFGSLFAEQIRAIQKSYPFLEVVGAAGAGKSTLIEFLWKLLGRDDFEGFDPNKETVAARARKFSQGANIPVSLIESDREDKSKVRQFDWDELKTAYNGRSHRGRGVKNSGNDTDDQPFRGSIVITQNNAVNASEAIMSRIVHFYFTTETQTKDSYRAAKELESTEVKHVNYFIRMACLAEKSILATVKEKAPAYEQQLSTISEIKSNRIAKNHSQMMALVDALAPLIGLTDDQHDAVISCFTNAAIKRQAALAADHPIVADFWEVVEYLQQDGTDLNHSRNDKTEIAINLNDFVRWANIKQQTVPPIQDLKKHLKQSQSRKFKDVKVVNSGLEQNKSIRCWIFETEGKQS
ncbi:toprim domain-containing protein [Kiloniella laminariae]|uniref:Toprim domain-containing protein n=1 Tax=Kiloniella laminariae TaxID=454162 RepID=A0ABT4LKN7_9PROT|nr:toprim domain-containing protein [Kiloniella laminariae]MCZ4281678.1 toprim domain-containing protein [Kiloniella laminariae]